MSKEHTSILLAGGLTILFGLTAKSETMTIQSEMRNDPAYFQIGSVEMKTEMLEAESPPPIGDHGKGIGGVISGAIESISEPLAIAEIALKVWDIIQENKAVMNVEGHNAQALPNIANKNWSALTGWKPERALENSFSIYNLYGMKTVDMKYQVILLYGGNYRGKGQYIASARVVPTKVHVAWGYSLNVSVNVTSVINEGTVKNPLASISLDVNYDYGTILSKDHRVNSYNVKGDGTFSSKNTNKVYFAPQTEARLMQ